LPPILERPSRAGHFYGNTVRRADQRRHPQNGAAVPETAAVPPTPQHAMPR